VLGLLIAGFKIRWELGCYWLITFYSDVQINSVYGKQTATELNVEQAYETGKNAIKLGVNINIFSENMNGRDHLGDLGVDGEGALKI
jgi:hypothetical protein